MKRKEFLHLASAGMIGAALQPHQLFAASAVQAKMAVQLYTIRDQIKENLEASLAKLASIGFKHVETAFWPEHVSLMQAAAALKKFGLGVSSCHIELPLNDAQKKIFLDTAAAFESKKMIWHGWPQDQRYSSLEGTKELIRIYNQSAAFAKSNGLSA